ncbi:molybdate ABC transporter substrate-binding protein [Gemmatimonadetes bacterium T265]|nr:molybdate ABC transporter substrate-binding protein [Gemmatimonadetes bacterium T265]
MRALRAAVVGGLALGAAPGPRAPGGHVPRAQDAPLLVFAAADLREVLPELAAAYRRAGGDSVVVTFGATGDLALQIANGAPADLFFAADEAAVARLTAQHAVVERTRRLYAIGRLALAVSPAAGANQAGAAGAPPRLADLARASVRTVAVADPARAPYGRAAREALERAGLWAQVGPKVVYTPNVAQAYRVVQDGNADAGFVSRAALSRAAPASYALVDTTLYAPIRQAAAVVAASRRQDAASRFLDYTTGSAGFAVLRRYGFAPPPGGLAAAPAAAPR